MLLDEKWSPSVDEAVFEPSVLEQWTEFESTPVYEMPEDMFRTTLTIDREDKVMKKPTTGKDKPIYEILGLA